MRKILVLCGVLLFPAFSFAKKNFKLEGHLSAVAPSSVIYLTYNTGADDITDSVRVQNGNFVFSGDLDQVAYASLRLRHGDYSVPINHLDDARFLFLEPRNISVSGTDSIKTAHVEGSKLNAETDDFFKQLTAVKNEIKHKSKIWKNEIRINNLDLKEAKKEYMALMDKGTQIRRDFITGHHKSYLSLVIFEEAYMMKDNDPLLAAKMFKKLSHKLRKTPKGQKLAAIVRFHLKGAVGTKLDLSDYKLQDGNGDPFDFSELQGKYVLINFWASWNKTSRKNIDQLHKIDQKYSGKNFTIMDVSLDKSFLKWRDAIVDDSRTWPEATDLKVWEGQLVKDMGILQLPANVLVSPDGIIVAKDLTDKQLDEKLSSLLD